MEVLIADKGYDANYMVEAARAVPVIPPRSNKKIPREYDKELYKERNLIERMFKHFRRVATRYSHNFPIFCSHCWHLSLVKINVDTT